MPERGIKIVAKNKKAYHDYFVDEKFEAGIQLHGTEVKSLRLGAVNLKESFCGIKDGEIFAYGMHISPYEKGNIFNRDPMRPKKLLMHKKEINRLYSMVKQQGCTVIPLSIYFRNSLAKMELGLCRGKKLHDKRESSAAKDAQREMQRNVKQQAR